MQERTITCCIFIALVLLALSGFACAEAFPIPNNNFDNSTTGWNFIDYKQDADGKPVGDSPMLPGVYSSTDYPNGSFGATDNWAFRCCRTPADNCTTLDAISEAYSNEVLVTEAAPYLIFNSILEQGYEGVRHDFPYAQSFLRSGILSGVLEESGTRMTATWQGRCYDMRRLAGQRVNIGVMARSLVEAGTCGSPAYGAIDGVYFSDTPWEGGCPTIVPPFGENGWACRKVENEELSGASKAGVELEAAGADAPKEYKFSQGNSNTYDYIKSNLGFQYNFMNGTPVKMQGDETPPQPKWVDGEEVGKVKYLFSHVLLPASFSMVQKNGVTYVSFFDAYDGNGTGDGVTPTKLVYCSNANGWRCDYPINTIEHSPDTPNLRFYGDMISGPYTSIAVDSNRVPHILVKRSGESLWDTFIGDRGSEGMGWRDQLIAGEDWDDYYTRTHYHTAGKYFSVFIDSEDNVFAAITVFGGKQPWLQEPEGVKFCARYRDPESPYPVWFWGCEKTMDFVSPLESSKTEDAFATPNAWYLLHKEKPTSAGSSADLYLCEKHFFMEENLEEECKDCPTKSTSLDDLTQVLDGPCEDDICSPLCRGSLTSEAVKACVEDCVKKITVPFAYEIANQGGFVDFPEGWPATDLGYKKVANYLNDGSYYPPPKEQMQQQINYYLAELLPACTNYFWDFYTSASYNYGLESANANSQINDDDIFVNANYPAEAGNWPFPSSFGVSVPIKLGRSYNIATSILPMAQSEPFNPQYLSGLGLPVSSFVANDSILYYIQDPEASDNYGSFYSYNFAVNSPRVFNCYSLVNPIVEKWKSSQIPSNQLLSEIEQKC